MSEPSPIELGPHAVARFSVEIVAPVGQLSDRMQRVADAVSILGARVVATEATVISAEQAAPLSPEMTAVQPALNRGLHGLLEDKMSHALAERYANILDVHGVRTVRDALAVGMAKIGDFRNIGPKLRDALDEIASDLGVRDLLSYEPSIPEIAQLCPDLTYVPLAAVGVQIPNVDTVGSVLALTKDQIHDLIKPKESWGMTVLRDDPEYYTRNAAKIHADVMEFAKAFLLEKARQQAQGA